MGTDMSRENFRRSPLALTQRMERETITLRKSGWNLSTIFLSFFSILPCSSPNQSSSVRSGRKDNHQSSSHGGSRSSRFPRCLKLCRKKTPSQIRGAGIPREWGKLLLHLSLVFQDLTQDVTRSAWQSRITTASGSKVISTGKRKYQGVHKQGGIHNIVCEFCELLGLLPRCAYTDLTLNNMLKILRPEIPVPRDLINQCPKPSLASGWHTGGTDQNSTTEALKM